MNKELTVQKKPEVVQLIESKMEQAQLALPENTIRASQLQVAFLSAFNRKPELRECTHMSLCKALIDCASIGIVPETPEQHAYLISRRRNIAGEGEPPNWVRECELQISYRGFCHLIMRGDRQRFIKGDVVHEGDEFQFENGTTIICRHVPNLNDPERRKKPLVCAWALLEYPNGSKRLEIMDRDDLRKIKSAMLRQNKNKESPAWTAWETEMYRKAPIKRMAKTCDLGPEIAKAAEIDNESFQTLRAPTGAMLDNGAPEGEAPVLPQEPTQPVTINAEVVPADQDGHVEEEPDLF